MSTQTDVANAVINLTNVLVASIPNPADMIRIFTLLNNFVPNPITPSKSAIGVIQNGSSEAVADLVRRAAAVALAQATAQYQPTSQNDAQNIQQTVCDVLDNEILIAGDQGEDDIFVILQALRDSVAQDLQTRGAALPPLQTFMTNIPMPALKLAYQYYADISRTDQLIAFANPVHPAFMPTSFQALSS